MLGGPPLPFAAFRTLSSQAYLQELSYFLIYTARQGRDIIQRHSSSLAPHPDGNRTCTYCATQRSLGAESKQVRSETGSSHTSLGECYIAQPLRDKIRRHRINYGTSWLVPNIKQYAQRNHLSPCHCNSLAHHTTTPAKSPVSLTMSPNLLR